MMSYKGDYVFDLEHPDVLFSDKQHFDNVRKAVCFSVINRGQLWYDTLSDDQKVQLRSWYIEWLNAWEHKAVPCTPAWLD